jgi:hypothetical protein
MLFPVALSHDAHDGVTYSTNSRIVVNISSVWECGLNLLAFGSAFTTWNPLVFHMIVTMSFGD